MNCEVFIDMKNENALYTVSMLSAMLESGTGNYLDMLAPFVLYSLPGRENENISIDAVTEAMREFGFKDFPHKTTEKILSRLCQTNTKEDTYVKAFKIGQKKCFSVLKPYDKTDFDSSKHEMRRKIDSILKVIQQYFEAHFYHETLEIEEIREKLINFFESNGLTVIQSVNDLRLLQRDSGNGSFEIAHFVLDEYEKKTLIYDELCDVTRGFLTYKALYYFTDEHKNSMNSKFRDVTFYLDCSLVLDALGYDTPEDENAIKELIRLVRRNGGDVKVFSHTIEEAAKLIESFANQPQNKNQFRLDGLAKKNLSRELLLMLAGQLSASLKDKAQVQTENTPSFADKERYISMLDEKEIITWLKCNRTKSREATYSDEERFQFDASSLNSIAIIRYNNHPSYIEHAKAMLVTQDAWLNRCLRELYVEKFKSELLYTISDFELVSLLWLRDYKDISNLPSDILIANAHAACRPSLEVIDRAIEIANSMVATGTLSMDAALLVSAHPDFKGFIAERVRNNPSALNENEVQETISAYIAYKSLESIENAREEERDVAAKERTKQKKVIDSMQSKFQSELLEKDTEIKGLKEKIEKETKAQLAKKIMRAEKYANNISRMVFYLLQTVIWFAGLFLIAVFGKRCYMEFIDGNAWLPYLLIEILSFISIPAMLLSKKSIFNKIIFRLRDKVYSAVYSCIISKD